MSKKSNGKAAKPAKRKSLCERCGQVAKASVKVTEPPSWAHKAGDFSLLRTKRRALSLEEARECAIAAGIIDHDGNLMPRYQ
ncbi:hypothetical protein [Roseateles sp. L2-2]|uniref:hypothetical protein n=1 Tax=Roseateles sp. L2-2 TaxID=3422597 RepID=UPI003D3633C4